MSFNKQHIAYSETGFFSKTVIDYLNNDEKLKPFYDYPCSIESFKQKIEERKNNPVNRKILVDVLTRQYSIIPSFQHSLLSQLLDENTFTITTGHQLNIFTGPLYFVLKIFSAINLAEELKRNYPLYNFIPVYWMASEDHDFAEINHIHVFDKKVEWNMNAKGACGRLNTSSLKSVIEELKTVLGESEHAKKLISIFENSYLSNHTLADATCFLVNELFGKYGLLIIDADDIELKKLAIPLFKKELVENFSFKDASISTEALSINYKTQIHPRSINLFYLKDGIRERIEFINEQFEVLNTEFRFNSKEMLALMETHPEYFSPNVVLRPLFQELILPNLAYIGGGAEISYWLQLKRMFDKQHISFPVLVLRDSLMLIDKNLEKKISELGFTVMDLFLSYDELVKKFMHEQVLTGQAISFAHESASIEKIFDNLFTKTTQIDATLAGAVNAEKQKALNGIKTLEDKITKALKRKNETSLNQIKNIKDKLFPENELHERYFNFSMYYLKYGDDFFNELKNAINPLEKKFLVLTEA